MKTRKALILTAIPLILGLSLLLAFLVSAQTAAPGEEEAGPEPVMVEPATTSQPAAPSLDGEPESVDVAVAVTNDVVQVQGRLLDSSGNPVNGSRSITASLYEGPSGGVARCVDTDPVTVVDGLFELDMDFCTASDFNGDQLYLGIKVESDPEMTPRRPIFAVPYAWGLRPGAIVKGADSTVTILGSALIKNISTDTTRWDIQANGAARIWRGTTAGNKIIYLPISIPSTLYGQNVTLKRLTVNYKVSNAANAYIDRTALNVQTDADSFVNVVDNFTNRTSTTAASYALTLSSNNVLSSTHVAPVVFLDLFFNNNTDFVDIGSIQLLLGHQ